MGMATGRNSPAKQAVKNVPTTIDLANGSIVAIESATVDQIMTYARIEAIGVRQMLRYAREIRGAEVNCPCCDIPITERQLRYLSEALELAARSLAEARDALEQDYHPAAAQEADNAGCLINDLLQQHMSVVMAALRQKLGMEEWTRQQKEHSRQVKL
jgi:hypothetical protein